MPGTQYLTEEVGSSTRSNRLHHLRLHLCLRRCFHLYRRRGHHLLCIRVSSPGAGFTSFVTRRRILILQTQQLSQVLAAAISGPLSTTMLRRWHAASTASTMQTNRPIADGCGCTLHRTEGVVQRAMPNWMPGTQYLTKEVGSSTRSSDKALGTVLSLMARVRLLFTIQERRR